jgi:hypothetical protein
MYNAVNWSMARGANRFGLVESVCVDSRLDDAVGQSWTQTGAPSPEAMEFMDQIYIKTPNPKCHLYWCLKEFVD